MAGKNTVIDIYNLRGQKLLSHSVAAGSLEANIEMPANMARGVYIVKVNNVALRVAVR
jgi:hypothetical protein